MGCVKNKMGWGKNEVGFLGKMEEMRFEKKGIRQNKVGILNEVGTGRIIVFHPTVLKKNPNVFFGRPIVLKENTVFSRPPHHV